MNESGRSVGAAMRFFKSPVESLVVVHDDVDLERVGCRFVAAAGWRPQRPQVSRGRVGVA